VWKKRVAAPGTYQTPDGLAEVTPARIRHWHDTIQALLKEGHKPPVSWGHVSKAVPASEDDAAFWSARFIAGKFKGSEIDPLTGELLVEGDTPGVEQDSQGRLISDAALPDGRTVKTCHEEVSIGAMDWTDGQGKLWPDAPVHLALTPLPVWVPVGGQPAFEPADLPARQRFGTANLLVRFATEPPMADDNGDKKEGEKKEGETPAEGGGDLKKALKMLARCGITLPDDTNPENLVERLLVACTAKEGDMDETTAPPPAEDKAIEEPSGTFLSTLNVKDPVTRALMADREQADRKGRLARVDALAARGLPPFEAKRLREAATRVRFAVARDGTVQRADVDDQLALLERVLPAGGYANLLRDTAGVTVETPPEGELDVSKKNDRVADEVSRSAGFGPPRRK